MVEVIQGLRLNGYDLAKILCKIGMARSTFYYHLEQLDKHNKWDKVKLRICQIYDFHKGRYGYRRITQELRNGDENNTPMKINHKTVYALMKELKLSSMVRVKKYHSYKGEVGRISPNLLKRKFKTDSQDVKWSTDVTEFSLLGIKLYLSPILDLFNGEVIDYTIFDRPVLNMVLEMVSKTIKKRPDCAGVILHSDRGWHYQHRKYRNMLKKYGIMQSMSRRGNCLDNACSENFFGLLKSEFLYLQKFSSIEQFKRELEEYIWYYNNDRIKIRLGTSPVKYRVLKTDEKLLGNSQTAGPEKPR